MLSDALFWLDRKRLQLLNFTFAAFEGPLCDFWFLHCGSSSVGEEANQDVSTLNMKKGICLTASEYDGEEYSITFLAGYRGDSAWVEQYYYHFVEVKTLKRTIYKKPFKHL